MQHWISPGLFNILFPSGQTAQTFVCYIWSSLHSVQFQQAVFIYNMSTCFKAHLAVLYLRLWCHCFPNTVFVTNSLTQPHHCHPLLWNITLNSTVWVSCTSWCHSVSQGWSCDILYWRYNMTTLWCGELYSYCSITILWVWFISWFFLWN